MPRKSWSESELRTFLLENELDITVRYLEGTDAGFGKFIQPRNGILFNGPSTIADQAQLNRNLIVPSAVSYPEYDLSQGVWQTGVLPNTIAIHDGTGGMTAGPCFFSGVQWVNMLDNSIL